MSEQYFLVRKLGLGREVVSLVSLLVTVMSKQEAQLMLTNPCDAFRGQSRSTNMAPFHMLVIFTLV